jgi:glycosyltransferase involved in cell wall biosynthesis
VKVAIVVPHPLPLAIGGAENLWWGLQAHIASQTPHSCDILGYVSPERTLAEVVGSYRMFSELDLSAYDRVISTKYPAWMVEHPDHVCYLQHRLRGLYDTYPGPAEPAVPYTAPAEDLLGWMRRVAGGPGVDRAALAEFFERFEALKDSGEAGEAFAFPGPFAREVVHFLDGAALTPGRIRRFAAISATVAARADYFPAGADVHVVHHPPHRSDYRCGAFDYLFTSSRLDGPKRVALLVEAMRHVSADVKLLIAGTGPDEARLKAAAGGDPRIRFLGYVEDDAIPGLYADALAVPFVPYDEDYGLITIEAMLSGKPVITLSDSGGPCEFVADRETGYVVAPDPAAFGARIQHLATHRDEARRMGEVARRRVSGIGWAPVADILLAATDHKPARRRAPPRPKLTVATTFPIWPPMGGGQARIFHLYRNLARHFDVDIVSYGQGGTDTLEAEIAPGVNEIRIAKSDAHAEREQALMDAVGGRPIGDIAAHLLGVLTPDYRDALEASALASAAVVASHPYLVDDIKAVAPGKPFWYEAHNVEIELKRAVLDAEPQAAPLLDMVRGLEARCWREASQVFACATRDLDALAALFGPTRAVLHEVPNGVALEEIAFTPPGRRRALQAVSGLGARRTAIFIGSWHGPNLEAVEAILQAAPAHPDMRFVVAGSACMPFRGRPIPANVDMLGQVDHATRDALLAAADIALNPMRTGSGTNLKMLDYFAAGIPVLSTRFGARGLKAVPGRHYLAADGDLAAAIAEAFAGGPEPLVATCLSARALVEADYGWDVIAERFARALARSGFPVPGLPDEAAGHPVP